MENKYLCIILCVLSWNYVDGVSIHMVNGTIRLTMGTSAGCINAARFMVPLLETYNEYKEFMEIKFVPWGRTRYEADGSMWCQFGPNDCWANRVHRCALHMLEGNQDAQVNYMACEFTMDTPRPAFALGSYQCAQAAGLNIAELDHCVTTTGRPLDDAAQEAAREPMRIINFVAHVHFHDYISRRVHDEAWRRLNSMVCFAVAEDPTTGVTDCQI